MTNNLPTFLDNVRARRAEISRAKEALEKEDQELAIAEKVAEKLDPSLVSSVTRVADPDLVVPNKLLATAAPKRHSDLVLSTLKASANTWFESSEELREEVRRIYGIEIIRGSFLPLLTSLKNEGLIVRDGRKVALAEKTQ